MCHSRTPAFLDLGQAVSTWPQWGLPLTRPPELVGPVPGGRTNRSFLLRTTELQHDLLLRLNNLHGDDLGINRTHEMEIIKAVAGAGLTYDAHYWDPAQRFTIFRHINARTWTSADFSNTHQRQQLLDRLALARELQPASPRRRYFAYLDHYWQQLKRANAVENKVRFEWQAFALDLQAFDQADWPVQLTHHDLIPENVMQNGDRLYLIDWEYAALGHPDIDYWSIDPKLVKEPFIHDLAHWTNLLWERVVALQSQVGDSH